MLCDVNRRRSLILHNKMSTYFIQFGIRVPIEQNFVKVNGKKTKANLANTKMNSLIKSSYLILILCSILTSIYSNSVLEFGFSTNEDLWNSMRNCPDNTYANGFSLRFEDKKNLNDLNGLVITAIRFSCTREDSLTHKGDTLDTEIKKDSTGIWTKDLHCHNGIINGIQIKLAAETEENTKEGIAKNMRVFCSDGEILQHSKLAEDYWNDDVGQCEDGKAICGIQTEMLQSNQTGPNSLRFECCNVQDPSLVCNPRMNWHKISHCENPISTTKKTCQYSTKIGLSYAGKFKEADIYEHLGFELNKIGPHILTKLQEIKTQFYNGSLIAENNWKLENENIEEFKEISAEPGFKTNVFQLIGHCDFYKVKFDIVNIIGEEILNESMSTPNQAEQYEHRNNMQMPNKFMKWVKKHEKELKAMKKEEEMMQRDADGWDFESDWSDEHNEDKVIEQTKAEENVSSSGDQKSQQQTNPKENDAKDNLLEITGENSKKFSSSEEEKAPDSESEEDDWEKDISFEIEELKKIEDLLATTRSPTKLQQEPSDKNIKSTAGENSNAEGDSKIKQDSIEKEVVAEGNDEWASNEKKSIPVAAVDLTKDHEIIIDIPLSQVTAEQPENDKQAQDTDSEVIAIDTSKNLTENVKLSHMKMQSDTHDYQVQGDAEGDDWGDVFADDSWGTNLGEKDEKSAQLSAGSPDVHQHDHNPIHNDEAEAGHHNHGHDHSSNRDNEHNHNHRSNTDHNDHVQVINSAKDSLDKTVDAVQKAIDPSNIQETIDDFVNEGGKVLNEVKEMPIVKNTQDHIDSIINGNDNHEEHSEDSSHKHASVKMSDEVPAAQDNSEIMVGEEEPASDASKENKISNALLGYIVGGMVVGVCIIVIIIFVLERRKQPRPTSANADNKSNYSAVQQDEDKKTNSAIEQESV